MKVIFNKIENKKLILDLENFKCINFLCMIREYMLCMVLFNVFIGFFLKYFIFRIIVFMNDFRNYYILIWI